MNITDLHKSSYVNEYLKDSATKNTNTKTTTSVFQQSDEVSDNSKTSTADAKSLDSFFNGANYSKSDYEQKFGTKISDQQYTELKTQYHDPLKAKDYVFDNVDQEGLNSCYMLSSLSSKKDDIEKSKCMKWNDDGSCDVSFYKVEDNEPQMGVMGALKNYVCGSYKKEKYQATDEKNTYHITSEELKKTDFQGTRDGKPETIKLSNTEDITAKAMEVALLKYHNNEAGFKGMSGTTEKMQKMLYGKNAPEVRETWPGRISRDQIDKATTCKLPVKGSLITGSDAKKLVSERDANGTINVNDVSGKSVSIVDEHAYTVNGYDKATDSVSISNPHSNDLNSTKDDIVLPFKTFKNLFCIEYIDK